MPEETIIPEFEKPIIELENRINELKQSLQKDGLDLTDEIKQLEEKLLILKQEVFSKLSPWQKVQLSRYSKRPYTLDYINLIFENFIELHGDRLYSDDKAIVCSFATMSEEKNRFSVCIIGHQKGRTVQEAMMRNFGMPHPEGYRKALRVMRLAEKFKIPLITFIDTPGAFPGIGAEERGQAEAIAKNLQEMSELKIPIVSVVIGEGGSGGALGIGVCDRLLMLENSWYSVISPEGCAAILFKDASKAEESANALKLTAKDLFELDIVDEIIPEPLGGAHRDVETTSKNLKKSLLKHLTDLSQLPQDELIKKRYEKYKKIRFFENKKKMSRS